MAESGFTIGRLAVAAGVNVETVRYYQRIKLMPVPARAMGGIRRYGAGELSRLRFIRSAQGLGFSLDEIADRVALDDGTRCKEAQQIAVAKLAAVRSRLCKLRRIESVLVRLVHRCESRSGTVRCPLIESLTSAGARAPSPRSL